MRNNKRFLWGSFLFVVFLWRPANMYATDNSLFESDPVSYLKERRGSPLLIKHERLQAWLESSKSRFPLDEEGLYYIEVYAKSMSVGFLSHNNGGTLTDSAVSSTNKMSAWKEFLALSPQELVEFIPLKGRTNIPHGYWFYNYHDRIRFFIAEQMTFPQSKES